MDFDLEFGLAPQGCRWLPTAYFVEQLLGQIYDLFLHALIFKLHFSFQGFT